MKIIYDFRPNREAAVKKSQGSLASITQYQILVLTWNFRGIEVLQDGRPQDSVILMMDLFFGGGRGMIKGGSEGGLSQEYQLRDPKDTANCNSNITSSNSKNTTSTNFFETFQRKNIFAISSLLSSHKLNVVDFCLWQ